MTMTVCSPVMRVCTKALGDLELPNRNAGIRRFSMKIAPRALTLGFPAHQFERRGGPHRLHQMGLFLGAGENLLFHPPPHAGEQGERNRQIEQNGEDHDQRKGRGVEEQNEGRDERHHAVDDAADDALADRRLDRLHRLQAGEDVADVPLLEIVAGEPQQMADEIAGDLKAQQMPENPQRPAPQCFDRRLHDDQAAERQRNDQSTDPGRIGPAPRPRRAAIETERRMSRSAARPTRQESGSSATGNPRRRDQRNDSLIGAFAVIGSKPSARASSSTTPVKCLENCSMLSVRTPTAGS